MIDAYKLVNELGLKNKISTCMEVCIFDIIKIIDIDKVIKIMKDNNEKRFSHMGEDVIDVNNKIVDIAIDNVDKIEIAAEWINLEYSEKKNLSFDETIGLLKGNSLPVSAFLEKKSGIFPGGSTKKEKRDIWTAASGRNC